MRIFNQSTVKQYYELHPESKTALQEWVDKTKKADWKCFADVKSTFRTADNIGNQHYVFNIKGNDFRLIVVIKYTPGFVYIRFIGTHAEYSRLKNIQDL